MTDISGTITKNQRMTGDILGSLELTGSIVSGKSLNGYISNQSNLEGYAEGVEYLSGSMSGGGQFSGAMNAFGNLIGTVYAAMDHSGIEVYDGSYEATPTSNEQTFPTKFKKMIDDFKVNATPMSDVRTVDTDGYTITVL